MTRAIKKRKYLGGYVVRTDNVGVDVPLRLCIVTQRGEQSSVKVVESRAALVDMNGTLGVSITVHKKLCVCRD